eukprot:4354206-Amphidinium_carterae.2
MHRIVALALVALNLARDIQYEKEMVTHAVRRQRHHWVETYIEKSSQEMKAPSKFAISEHEKCETWKREHLHAARKRAHHWRRTQENEQANLERAAPQHKHHEVATSGNMQFLNKDTTGWRRSQELERYSSTTRRSMSTSTPRGGDNPAQLAKENITEWKRTQ